MKKWIYASQAFLNEEVQKDIWLAVEDGLIADIRQNHVNWVPEEGEILRKETSGFLMPGMIDTHVHLVHDGVPNENWELDPVTVRPGDVALRALSNAQRQLHHGVTTVRDLGSRDLADIVARDAINSGRFQGCRIIAAGHPITTTAGHMDPRHYIRPGIPYESTAYMGILADCEDEARRAVRQCVMDGADVIKINVSISEPVRRLGGLCAPEMSLEMMRVICEMAHHSMRRVTGHSHGGVAVDNAITAGIDSLEHGRFLTDEQLDTMAKKGIFLTPTLCPDCRPPKRDDDPRSPALLAWTKRSKAVMMECVKRAVDRGVKVTAGSDSGMPYVRHGDVAYEAEYLSEAGLSSKQALLAVTETAAQNLGIDGLTGSLKIGLSADLLMLKGNPLDDITLLQKNNEFSFIMKEGVLID